MYNDLLKTSWDDMMYSEYEFKSNSEKRIVEMVGNQFDENDSSLIVIYYNMFTGYPMILIQRYNHILGGDTAPEVEGYTKTYNEVDDEELGSFTDIVYISQSLQRDIS